MSEPDREPRLGRRDPRDDQEGRSGDRVDGRTCCARQRSFGSRRHRHGSQRSPSVLLMDSPQRLQRVGLVRFIINRTVSRYLMYDALVCHPTTRTEDYVRRRNGEARTVERRSFGRQGYGVTRSKTKTGRRELIQTLVVSEAVGAFVGRSLRPPTYMRPVRSCGTVNHSRDAWPTRQVLDRRVRPGGRCAPRVRRRPSRRGFGAYITP